LFLYASDNRLIIQRGLSIGALLGLLIVTHPAASVLSMGLIAAAVAYLRRGDVNTKAFVVEGFFCCVSALCVSSLLLCFIYPLDAKSWLDGIYEHSFMIGRRTDTGEFLKYFLMTKMFPALLLPLASMILILVYAIQTRAIGKNRWISGCFVISVVCFVVGIYYTSIRIPAAFYNFSVFVPAIAFLSFYSAASERNGLAGRWRIIPIAAFALACALAQLMWLTQKVFYASDYDRLASQVNNLVGRYSAEHCQLAMDPPIATAIDNVNLLKNSQLIFFDSPAKESNNLRSADVLLRAQTELRALPGENANFALVKNEFYSGSIARFIKPESLYFAAYQARSSGHCGKRVDARQRTDLEK
jgi:hypothetical protein